MLSRSCVATGQWLLRSDRRGSGRLHSHPDRADRRPRSKSIERLCPSLPHCSKAIPTYQTPSYFSPFNPPSCAPGCRIHRPSRPLFGCCVAHNLLPRGTSRPVSIHSLSHSGTLESVGNPTHSLPAVDSNVPSQHEQQVIPSTVTTKVVGTRHHQVHT